MSRLLLVTLLLVLAGVVAGCGGGGEPTVAEYEQAVVAARNRTDFAIERITRAPTMDELLTRMDEAEVVIDRSADELEDVGAPGIFTEENERLVTSLHALANDVGLTADQVRLPGFENFLSGARGINYESWDKVNRALASLVGDGIDVQLLVYH